MKPSENFQNLLGLIFITFAAIAFGEVAYTLGDWHFGAFIVVSIFAVAATQAPRFHNAVAGSFLVGVAAVVRNPTYGWLPVSLVLLSGLLQLIANFKQGDLRFSYRVLALAIWIAILGRASGPEGGADPLREFLMRFLPSESSVEFAVIAIRKSIHFIFYGIMAAMACLSQDRETRSSKTIITVSLFVVLCEAILDEIRQSQFANRTGSAWDVVLDLAGAVFVLWLMNRRDKKPTESVLS